MIETGLVDIEELRAIDDLEQRLANCSTCAEREPIEAELQKLRERLNAQFGARMSRL